MKILYIGCVETSVRFLEEIEKIPRIIIAGIVSRSQSPGNSDFYSLLPYAELQSIPALDFHPKRKELLFPFVEQLDVDVIFCFGWSHILPVDILKLPPRGAVGFHPSLLPKGRGRHPIIWTLALGLGKTASSFFMMTENADDGDIVCQTPITVADNDDARALYDRIMDTACTQLRDWVPKFECDELKTVPQDPKDASVWRKRNSTDGCIDWRMPAEGIHNLVRALARPYPGATTHCGDTDIVIWKTEVVSDDNPYIEPGRVVYSSKKGIIVKCGEGCIRVLEHEFPSLPEEGTYL